MWLIEYDPRTGEIITKKTVVFKEEDRENVLYFDEEPDGWHIDLNSLKVVQKPIVQIGKKFSGLDVPPVVESPPDGSKNSICFVRMIGLGDIRMSIPSVAAFKSAYPDWHVTYATCYPSSYMLRGVDAVDSIRIIEYKTPSKGLPPIPRDVGGEFTVVVNWINRVDFGEVVRKGPRADNFLNVMNNKITSVGLDPVETKKNYLVPKIPIYSEEYEWGQDCLIHYGIGPEDIVIGCQLSSHGDCRKWSLERWYELAEMNQDWRFLFFSDKEEHADIEVPENVANTSCALNIREFLVLFSMCHACVYPDSAGMHLSPAFGVPGVLLSGSTKVEYHLKYYPKDSVYPIWSKEKLDCSPCFDWQVWNKVKHDAPPCYAQEDLPWCLNQITARDVTEEIVSILL